MRGTPLAWLALGCTGFEATPDKQDTGTTPEADLDADTDSDVDADTDVDTDSDSDADTDTETPADGYRHTIVVDGDVSDFTASETFPTSAGGTTFLAWDDDALYVGVRHPDVGASALHWVVVTVGNGDPGASEGPTHGTQAPALPFAATRVVRWKADDSYDSLLVWNGAGFDETAGFLGSAGSAYASDSGRDE